ncbi:penicillin-binding transpeptidase domain-containing protein [Streptomyces sp. Li-HN-5-11]|uniref:penicillin-binding transpeptidase domain-containing protein n=1 Tax=Streptomyces sp. Li-HN-5-11 TaxID=3075432 RepID=UPI0028A9BD52|nr:penicillin-binding transpeptidase domain-containing protein [Streptomyces sp. Li-HN-5-11]WNM33657.1 penicillin-binding transpeptidase domain-containing protein [Streptomyces sp. Li-HN-5-11]
MRTSRLAAALTAAALIFGGVACDADTTAPRGSGVTSTATAFLSAWQAGDIDKAAQLTTSPQHARTELRAYRDQTGVTSVSLNAEPAHGATVPFKATAHITYLGTRATWSYTSKLLVVSDPDSGKPRVAWHSNVIHPALPDGGGYTLQPFSTSPQPVITDQHGTPLTARDYPGLEQILTQLQHRYQETSDQALQIRLSSAGDSGQGRIITTLNAGDTGRLRTRLDAAVQKAVHKAVLAHPGSSVVVIRPSTGDILAAHTNGTAFDPALEGTQAPGQIFELVTTAALLERQKVTPRTKVTCPASTTVAGQTFTNPGGQIAPGALFADVFTHACDTGYVQLADALSGTDLSGEARDVFGLGLDWQTGVTTADGAVPVLDGADKAAAAIGRGEVRLNTLNLASLAATIQNGSFKQPLFVDPKTSGKTPAKTRRSLPGHAADDLRALMRAYAHDTGINGAAFGGVADQFHDSPDPIVGWFTAFHGDLAVAATAPEETEQPQTARAVVRAVIDAAATD